MTNKTDNTAMPPSSPTTEDDIAATQAADITDRLRGLWEALAYLEQEAGRVVTTPDVGILIGCARMALERHYGGAPPPEPGNRSLFN